MNRLTRLCTPVLALAAAVALAACEDSSPLQPESTSPSLSSNLTPGEQVCEVVGFGDFSHGDAINSLSAFDATLSVATEGNDPRSQDQARAYDTSDPVGPDPDLEASADCPDCSGLGSVMVIADQDFANEGDSESGGTVTITGFPSEGETFIDAFKVIDHDGTENPIELYVDGTKVGQSTAMDDGSVQTVDVTDTNISTKAEFVYNGSGAVDDIEICHTPPERGDEGCTPGYWKQPHHFDSWPSAWTDADGYPNADFCSSDGSGAAFTCESMISLDRPERGNLNDVSLLEALSLRGGGVNALARHAAAAALNASGMSGVDYYYTLDEVQTLVNDALTSGEYESAKDDLEEANEAMCPLD